MNNSSFTKSSMETTHAISINNEYVLYKLIYTGKKKNLYLTFKINDPYQIFVIIIKKTTHNESINEIQYLERLQNFSCTPKLIKYGVDNIKGQKYDYQIFNKQGPSIKLLYNYLKHNISIPILCLIAIQSLHCLEKIHMAGVIHCNVRPKKMLITPKGKEILLTDLTRACKFKKVNQQYTVNAEQYQITSQTYLSKFSSIGQHIGQLPSPKDDLESLAYILLFYTNCYRLFKRKYESKQQKIKDFERFKLQLLPEQQFKGAPTEFIQFLISVRMSSALDYPRDYEEYRSLFRKTLHSYGYKSENQIKYPFIKKSQKNTVIYENEEFKDMIESMQSSKSSEHVPEEESVGYNMKQLEQISFKNPLG